MEQIILSVTDCTALINQTLDYAYPTVVVEGEVASFKVNKNKYVFFDIKDDNSVLSCFMMVYQLRIPLEDGMRVRIVAAPRLTAWGKFSLTVRQATPIGEGHIKRSFEILKAQLEKEGLFDPARKRSLPTIPERIGLIASVESAGYADFIKILQNRWSGLEIVVADVQVQGNSASDQIINALQYFNEHSKPAEVLAIVRGGGSIEDLAVFNDEALVRAVAASRIPTLVGVGHEIDVSLCDLAADVRAATPSNAAEILVPDKQAIQKDLQRQKQLLFERFKAKISLVIQILDNTSGQLIKKIDFHLQTFKRQALNAQLLLNQLDPKMVLKRGYGLVRDKKGEILRGNEDILQNDLLTIELEHAIITAGVKDVKHKE